MKVRFRSERFRSQILPWLILTLRETSDSTVSITVSKTWSIWSVNRSSVSSANFSNKGSESDSRSVVDCPDDTNLVLELTAWSGVQIEANGSVFSNRKVREIMVKTEEAVPVVSAKDQLRKRATSGEKVLALVSVAWLLREEILILWRWLTSST